MILCVLPLVLHSGRVGADAIIRTRAMLASTVAEYFVEAGRVTVEIEIGLPDLEAFENLLPDPLYEELGQAPAPIGERVERFFAHDFVLAADAGSPLGGRILEIGPRERVKRDAITGEPLPTSEGEEPEIVVFARLAWELPGKPETLTIFGPRGRKPASVGFVLYHGKVPVNDFRYLAARQTLVLDWGDPWYTHFEARALRRQYFAPMSGFLYVEPYEVRKEIIIRPRDLQRWVDLGIEGRETIPAEIQPELKRRAAEFLRTHQPVRIDGREIEPELARIHFLERTLRTSRVVDPPAALDVYSAILGVIFVYPTDGLPERVTMEWDLWSERTPVVPASAVDQAGGLPVLLEPDWRVLEWQNFLQNPELPTLQSLAPPPSRLARALGPTSWVLLAGTALLTARAVRRGRREASARSAWTPVALAALLTVMAFGGSYGTRWDERRAAVIVEGLLHNVYRAFDFRDEEQIYDVLARSVEGELLAQIYLDVRRGLELTSQGGARAKVKQLELTDLVGEPAERGGFRATATWSVAGSVGHWGHVHERRNQYRAELNVEPRDGSWKLVDLEVLEEERL